MDCPFVDFFCDAAGVRDEVNSMLVNKRRGWNAYFPMPFRKSARVELVYDGPLAAGPEALARYARLQLRHVSHVGPPAGDGRLFPRLLASGDGVAGERGIRGVGGQGQGEICGLERHGAKSRQRQLSVDENEKFFVDGEQEPSVEFQGLEDSFGFSWGFPESRSSLPWTGFYPFFKGACGYRFFASDAIPFQKSLRVSIGFGKHEQPLFQGLQQAGEPVAVLQHRVLVSDGAARAAAADAAGRRARRRRKTATGRERNSRPLAGGRFRRGPFPAILMRIGLTRGQQHWQSQCHAAVARCGARSLKHWQSRCHPAANRYTPGESP